jgi:spermidine synthase
MTGPPNEPTWIEETAFAKARLSFEVQRSLASEQTPQHRLELIENGLFGKVLLLDGAVQLTSADEFIYHEMMAHVPILAHGVARDILIVGGGDCGLAEEVLKHRQVRQLLQVEIDPDVVAFAKAHFAEVNAAAFADPRCRIEIGDGAAFVATTDRRFDIVLVDSTDPAGPGAALFTADFYRNVRRCLRPGGIVVTQSGVPFVQPDDFARAMGNLSAAFPVATCYVIAVPTYFGGHLALGWGSVDRGPDEADLDTLTARAASLATRYYTPQVHRAAFALPRYIAEAKDGATA